MEFVVLFQTWTELMRESGSPSFLKAFSWSPSGRRVAVASQKQEVISTIPSFYRTNIFVVIAGRGD